jgi:hypothetical protein
MGETQSRPTAQPSGRARRTAQPSGRSRSTAQTEWLAIHHVPPFTEYNPKGHSDALHEWRNEVRKKALWHRLDAAISRAPRVSVELVSDALKSGRFDTYTKPRGTVILEYPHFVNAFVDPFYLSLLESA